MEGQATGPSVSVEYQHLLQAISVRAAPIVHQLVRQFPGIVHQKGWNGQTPLHKVCLSGDWTITYLLLEAGANPNTRNDSEETPLHLACKRGDVSVVHLLIQHKGDITAVDKSGMGMMHHAAQTCSVYVFHYLSAIHGQSFGVHTNKHQTPLHICCDFGSSDIAVKYLLRKDRSDVTSTDSSGNTPLHLAANQGHAFISWLLLLAGGLKMLHLTNNNGDTPVALAKAGNKLTHKYLHGILQQLSSLPCVGYPTVPRCVWYGHLVMPGVVYALAVLVAQMVGAPYQGFIILTGLGYIIYSVRGHTHRIMHISRSPNPVFAGAFAAGVVHTFIMYCLILPYIYDYLLLTIVSISLAAVTLYLYIRLLRENAGITKTSVFLENSSERKTLLDLVGPPAKLGLFCPDCEIVHASSSKHCRLCDCCYEEMDHHCLFLMNCIAKNNRLMFVWFLIVVSLCKIVFVLNAMLYCSFLYKPPLSTDLIGDMFKSNAWLLSLVILNIVSCVFSINTAWFQISLVSLGLTTFLRPSKPETVLTTTERIINAIYFLQGKPIFVKDPLFDV